MPALEATPRFRRVGPSQVGLDQTKTKTKTHGLIYDGLWQGDGTTVLARFSRNGVMLKALNPALDSSDPDDWFRTPPNADDIGTVTKFSIALKVCPDQDLRKCRDLVFLPHDSVDWEHGNLFAQVQHTNVTFDPQTTWAFGGWAADVGHIRLDHMGTTHPTVISLVPSTRFVGQYRPHRDWRTLFGSLKQGEVLYTMYDQDGRKIATLELDEARVVASEFGDTRVHFRHNMLPSITPVDGRPVKLPRKIPPSWTSAPSLLYMVQKAIGARCGVDFNTASLDAEALAEANGLPTVLAPLLDVILDVIVHIIPSRVGSVPQYFVDSTQDIPDPPPPTFMTLLRNAGPFSPELTLQANEQATLVKKPQYSQRWWRIMSESLGGTAINNSPTLPRRVLGFGISNEEWECSREAMRPMLEAMWEHRAAIERMVIREWQLWHRMGKFSLASSGVLQGKQNDDRFRNQLDIDNDVWLDPFGGELPGCVDDLKPRFS